MYFYRFAVSLLGALLVSYSAFGQPIGYTAFAVTEEMLFADDPKDWAKPKVVVPPQFPSDQLAANTRGYVDVEVNLSIAGDVTAARVIKSEPRNEAFEKAVLEVASLWLFNVPLSNDCVPRESTGNVRIWFDVRDEKPVVSVSGNVSAASAPIGDLPRKADWENKSHVFASMSYPERALRDNVQVKLLAALHVAASTGDVKETVITWMETSSNASTTVAESFKSAVIKHMRRAKFKPRDGKDYRVCVPFEFRVTRR